MHVQHHANFSKQTTLLDGIDVGPHKWPICGRGLNCFVHEGMKDISNVKVHLKTCRGNVNIFNGWQVYAAGSCKHNLLNFDCYFE